MAVAALAALLATVLAPIMAFFASGGGIPMGVTRALRVMPTGWHLQLVSLVALVIICLAAMGRSNATLDWLGVGAGLTVLVGLGLTSHTASAADLSWLTLEMVHLWSTALWLSGLLFFLAGWRGLGSDVARFRTVRWVGGVLLAVSVVTGVARATPHFPSLGDLFTNRYGQVLAGKTVVVLVIIALGGVAMLAPRRANALQASRFLGTQALCAGLAALLAALLALLANPGIVTPPTLAGVSLSDVVTLDRAAFAADNGTIHLLTQPAMPGPQTLVVRLTSASGTPLAADRPPAVEVQWTALHEGDATTQLVALQADPSGVLFTGAAPLATGWRQADVVITPPDGVASRARFWLLVPDPNVGGNGPDAISDPEATALFERGLASLTALRSVRFNQSLADGAGTFVRSQVSVSAAEGERPAAFAETVLDADGTVTAAQTIVGNRRWVLDDGAWVAADPVPFQVPAGWGERYAGATGFQPGPREAIDGELSQVVTFQVPPRGNPAREPAWYAWWVGLASGQVRREVTISTRQYMVTDYRDFNASLGIEPPAAAPPPIATPTRTAATPEAIPAQASNQNP
jgi:putative copper export protein